MEALVPGARSEQSQVRNKHDGYCFRSHTVQYSLARRGEKLVFLLFVLYLPTV